MEEPRHSFRPEQDGGRFWLRDQIFGAVNDSIVVTDPNQPDNPIIYVNAAFERLTGYSSEEAVGCNCRFLQGSDRNQPVLEDLRAALLQERGFRGVLRNYRRDGSFFLNEISISPIHDAEGRLISFIGVQNDVTGRVETEEKLRRFGEELAAVFESITDAFFTLDNEWRFTYLNSEAERVLGREREELLGKNLWEEFPEATNLGFYREYRRAVENRETVEFEEYYPPFGAWFEVKAYPSEAGLSVYFRDITRRKKAEEDLRESEERLRAVLLQYASDIITILEADGTIRYESPAVEGLLGYRAEEMVGTNVFEYIHPDDMERATREFSRLLEDGESTLTVEVRFKSKDGSWRFVEGVGNNLLDEPGIRGIVINSRDVTDRRRAEQEWREAETRFRIAFENTDLGMALTSPEGGRYLEVNQACCDILGYSEEELLATTSVDLTHPEDRDATVDYARRAMAGEIDNYQWEKRYIHAEGHVIWASTGVSIVHDVEGHPQYFVVQMQDITERKRIEEALRRSEARNRAILEAYPDLMFRVSRDGEFLDFEANDDDSLYVPREEIVGSNIRDTLPPDVAAAVLHHLSRALETGETQTYEYRLSVPAGLRDFEARFIAIDENEALCIVRDATERKQAEEALRESERRFKQLFDQAVDSMLVHDESGRIVDCNAEACRAHGYSREELLSLSISDLTDRLLTEEERREQEKVGGTLWQRIVAGESDTFGATHLGEHRRKDGTTFPVEVRLGGVDYGGRRVILASVRDITERREAERRLEESRQRYRSLFEHNPDAVYSFDLEGNFLSANPACVELSGYPVEELLQMSFMPLIVPEDRERAWRSFEKATEGEPQNYEIAITHKDGHRVEFNVTKLPIVVGGEVVGVYGIAKDVTERKNAEEALRESEARFRTLFEQTTVGVCVADLDRRLIETNTAYQEITGYSGEELVGMSTLELTHPDDRADDTGIGRTFVSDESDSYRREKRYVRKNGEVVWAYAASTLVRDESGEPRFIMGVVEDVTERRRMDEELRESEERYRSLVELSPDAIAVHSEGEIVYINAAGVEMFGASTPDDLIGRKAMDFVHPDYREIVKTRIRRALEDGEPAPLIEEKYLRLDGSVMDVEIAGMPVNYLGKSSVQVVMRDVTERKRIQQELSDSERRYRSVLERTTDGIYIYDFETKRILECNTALEDMLGCTSEELIGMTIYDLIAHDRESIVRNAQRILEERSVFLGERRYRRRDGSLIDVETSAVLIPYGDKEAGCIIARDISRRKRTEAELRQRSVAMDTSIDGIAIIDANEEHVYVNGAYAQIYKYDDPEELIGESWRTLYDEWERKRFDRDVMPALRRDGRWRGEATGRRRDGSAFPQDASLTLLEEGGAVCVVRDITDRAELEKQLAHQALHDSLTGLPNRSLFMEHVERALARQGRREGSTVALLFLDLDGFKRVNDTLGHGFGDQLLVAVADRLRVAARVEDTIARLGGDEFTVLLEVGDVDEARRAAQRIIDKLQEPFFVEEHEVRITTSVGIALGDSYSEPESLLQDADLAMYEAKQSGSGLYKIFDAPMKTDAIERFGLKKDITKAVERHEFLVYYQPKVDVATGRIMGFEALVRWKHPELGLISPIDFIPEVEDTGLISSIGWWVFREACYQATEWQELYPSDPLLLVCINLSPIQLRNHALTEEVSTTLRESGVAPAGLGLEITERTPIHSSEQMEGRLHELKRLGLQLSLDDFGSGYSSLSYLKRLPVDILKIDQSFIDELPESAETKSIVSALISLARDLRIKVVAEGVERADQLQCLRELGCHMAQGHYFGEPLTAQEASDVLRKSRNQ